MAIMMLIGGIFGCVLSLGWAISCVGLMHPGTYYSLVFGILAIIKASRLLSPTAYQESPPKLIAIMQIINIVVGDIPNCVMGIIALVFLSEPEVRGYFRG